MGPLGTLAALLGGFWAAGRALEAALPGPRRNPRRRPPARARQRDNPKGKPFSGTRYRERGRVVRLTEQELRALEFCHGEERAKGARIPNSRAWARALLADNPGLQDVIEAEGGAVRQITTGGYFDAFNATRGRANRVKSWSQALSRAMPRSGKWADGRERLDKLTETAIYAGAPQGFRVQPPTETTLALQHAELDGECHKAGVWESLSRARTRQRGWDAAPF